GGVARDVTADMPGKHAGIEIIAAADAIANVKLDVPAFVKVGGTLRLRHRSQGKRGRNHRQARQHAERHFVLLRGNRFLRLRSGDGGPAALRFLHPGATLSDRMDRPRILLLSIRATLIVFTEPINYQLCGKISESTPRNRDYQLCGKISESTPKSRRLDA